ncbi:MAG TPA: transcription termination factor NusA [Candidatus Paceibacterota bacterium]
MDLKSLIQTVNQIAEDKGIEPDIVLGAIEDSLAAAYKKEYLARGVIVRAEMDKESGEMIFKQIKEVVDDSTVRMGTEEDKEEEVEESEDKLPLYNSDKHILIENLAEEAPKDKNAKVGDEIEFILPSQTDFGRIAAQTAKQVIIQKLREAERDSIIKEFKDKEGQIVSGVVQRFERGNVFVDLGRVTSIMPYNESIPGEHYRVGERLRFFVASVAVDMKTPGIILSRAHPKFVSRLFEMEVPEITDKIVEIKAIAREPGSRTKIAVYSNVEGVDPVGSCVGQRGTRVMAVTNELGAEKLDIIEWSDDPEKFIANAIAPAKAKSVEVRDHHEALVLVADDELSLAIGRGGQNVRLAAKLTGWKIDVRSQSRPSEEQEGGIASASKTESLSEEVDDGDKPVYHKKIEDED